MKRNEKLERDSELQLPQSPSETGDVVEDYSYDSLVTERTGVAYCG